MNQLDRCPAVALRSSGNGLAERNMGEAVEACSSKVSARVWRSLRTAMMYEAPHSTIGFLTIGDWLAS